MSYMDNFITRNVSPVEHWTEQAQELLNEDFINASNLITIGREIERGTLEFEEIDARITTTLDSKVGDKVNDDYRTIFFPDMSYHPLMGERFQFYNNIWIVYNTDNINSLYSACYVRRCNNTINSLDYYGRIHEEPCVIDLKPTKSSFVEKEEIWTVSTRQIIMYQKNKWTKDIGYNSRIMFEGETYRVGVNLNFDRLETFNKNTIGFVRAYLDFDLVNEFDNQEYQIADYTPPVFNFNVFTTSIPVSSTGTLECSVTRNSIKVDEEVVWESQNESLIKLNKNGDYTTETETGYAIITVSLKENPQIKKDIPIEIQEEVVDYYTTISPEDYYIPLNQKKTYQVFEYSANGEKQNTTFSFDFSQLSSSYYTAQTTPNSFSIYNKKQNPSTLLKVIIINNRTEEERSVYIELGGLF